jgi:hypothetical protein
VNTRIGVDGTTIADFCRRHSIRRLSLFGSVLRDDFRPESDVDVLIEFEEGARVGLFEFLEMRRRSCRDCWAGPWTWWRGALCGIPSDATRS